MEIIKNINYFVNVMWYKEVNYVYIVNSIYIRIDKGHFR